MKKFFYLHFKEDDGGGVAYSSSKDVGKDTEGAVKFAISRTVIQDYQANDDGLPLMSCNLKSVIESSVNLIISWKSFWIENGDLKRYEYFSPIFSSNVYIICREKSKVANGPIGEVIIKACLSEKKIGELEFFPLSNSSIRLIVSERLKAKIEESNLTGMEFSAVPVG